MTDHPNNASSGTTPDADVSSMLAAELTRTVPAAGDASSPTDLRADLDAAISSLLDAQDQFRARLTRINQAGLSANEIARRVGAAKILSRPKVLELLRDLGEGIKRAGEAASAGTAAMHSIGESIRKYEEEESR
ncbi:hypothetical protein GCM10022224_103870 [Nonomuraea antimicrobica]|uniref:Uncharacterized protein n=1 Tax=Nonomuraea antimicrobica TaxID=561173 RepID=A0ABP7ER37_9ACTN